MADNNEEQEIEEPAEVVEQVHKETVDHMPLKDEFSSDLSEIDLNDYNQKQEDQQAPNKPVSMKPKRKKILKTYRWKQQWVKQANAVHGSGAIWLKKWVKVKYTPSQEEMLDVMQIQGEKDKGALEMAHAIILQQMNTRKE